MNLQTLPDNWTLESLKDQISDFEKRNPQKTPNKSFKYVEIGGIDNEKKISQYRTILGKNAPSRARNVIRTNDVIYGITRPYFRNVALIGIEFDNEICSTGFCVLRINNSKIIPKFLYYYMISDLANNQILKPMRGGTYPAVSNPDVISIMMPIPPISIQKQIIKKLDYIISQILEKEQRFYKLMNFTKVTRSGSPSKNSQLNQLFQNLEYYSKQSILDYALDGNLTKKWRKNNTNIESGGDLLKKIQHNRIKKHESIQKKNPKKKINKKDFKITILDPHPLIPSWSMAKLENLIYIAGRIGWKGLTSNEYTENGPLFLSVYSLNYGDEVNFEKAFHISQKRYDESPEIQLQENDILLAKDGNIGKIGLVKNLQKPCTINSSLLLVRSQEAFIPKFLFYLLSGSTLQKLAREKTEHVTVPHLYQRDIKNFVLPVPPLEEQIEIVKLLDDKLGKLTPSLKSLELVNEKNRHILTQFTEFKRSILNSAFSGKLIK